MLSPQFRLNSLNLSQNLLAGGIAPFPLNYSVRFEVLDLSNNNLSGLIPSFFTTPYTRIRTLSLQNNRLSGDIVDLLIGGITYSSVEM